MKARTQALFAALLAAVLIAGSFAQAETKVVFDPADQSVTDTSNIVNGGCAAQGEGGTWYCNNGIWWKPDDGDPVMFWEDYATALMVWNGYLYYTDGEAKNALYRRKLPDGEKEEVVPFSSECFQIDDDGQLYFYCARRLEYRGIWTCAADGTGLTKISDANCTLLFLWNGGVWYVDKDQSGHLMRMDPDGRNVKKILKERINCAVGCGSYLFFSTTSYFGMCGANGRSIRKLLKIPAYRFVISGDLILLTAYSYNGTDDYPVGVFRLQSGNPTVYRISDDQGAALAVGSGQLYYKSLNYGLTLMRMGMDGSDPCFVAGGDALSLLDQAEQARNEAENAGN